MNEEWDKKLSSLGVPANLLATVAADPGAEASVEGMQHFDVVSDLTLPMLVELSSLAVVDIDGADAQEFLQAQVCNDLKLLSDSDAQLNGYCSPKGRLLALFTVFPNDAGYRIIVPRSVAPAFVKRLQMYVMRAKVDIAIRDDLVCSGLVLDSSDTQSALAECDHLPNLPSDVMHLSANESGQLLRCHDSSSDASKQNTLRRFVSIATQDDQLKLWQASQFNQVGDAYWRWLDINAGVPNVYGESVEQFIPQMLNMQHVNALSFKKGCYPGQEIVARMQYLGKLKKHMKHLRVEGATNAPSIGETLSAGDNNNAGQVVDAVVDSHGLNLLAVVNIETPVSDLRLADGAIEDASLPYTLEPPASDET